MINTDKIRRTGLIALSYAPMISAVFERYKSIPYRPRINKLVVGALLLSGLVLKVQSCDYSRKTVSSQGTNVIAQKIQIHDPIDKRMEKIIYSKRINNGCSQNYLGH